MCEKAAWERLIGTCVHILEFASKEPFWDYPRYILVGVIKKKEGLDVSLFSGDSVSSLSMV